MQRPQAGIMTFPYFDRDHDFCVAAHVYLSWRSGDHHLWVTFSYGGPIPEQNPCKKSYVIHSRLGSSVARDRLIGSGCNFAVGISVPMPTDVGG